MPTPSELVTDAFAQAAAYAADAQEQLTLFTSQLNASLQTAPLVDITFTSIAAPSIGTIAPYEPPADYTDSVITTLVDVILERLAGGTGLDPTVETALWDRARERESAISQAAIDQISRDAESLGYQLPAGVLNDGIRRETRAFYDKSSTFSRDVAIKQAELEQANMQQAIDKAIQYETALSTIIKNRSDANLAAFQAEVQRFVAEVEQEVKYWEVQIKQYQAQQEYILNGQKINTEVARANLAMLLEAAKVGAQVYAQLTASAYSLIHASAGVSGSSSTSVGYAYSNETANVPPGLESI